MRIVLAGLGEVGFHLADLLVREGHELTVIDSSHERVREVEDDLDATAIYGSSTRASILSQARVNEAHLFLALTSSDEVNLVSASVAKSLGARRVIARVHAISQRENRVFPYARHFHIDHFVSPERLAAARLAKEIRSPIAPVLDQFAQGSIEVVQITVEDKPEVIGKNLVELNLPQRMRIGLIERGEKVMIPNAITSLEEGDQLILVGAPAALQEGVQLLRGEKKPPRKRRIVLYGADDVGLSVLDYFSAVDADIKLIEPDLHKCEHTSELYPWVKVVHGHAIDSRLLLEENVMMADVFVAATRDDENNVMSCLQAVKLGIRPCLLTIHRPDYAGVLSDIGDLLGINATVSPRVVTGTELLRYATDDPYIVLWEMPTGEALVIQIRLDAKESDLFGKMVKELSWPKGVLLLAIQRADRTIVPTADDRFEQDDSLILLTLSSTRQKALDLFESAL